MAETVKKSRIVSDPDDNLEESLMEEFNLRLKNCMNNDEAAEGEKGNIPITESHLYENIHTNGFDQKVVDRKNCILPDLTNGDSQHFINVERDHISTISKTANLTRGFETKSYDNVNEHNSKTELQTDTTETANPEPVYDIPKQPPPEVQSSADEVDQTDNTTVQADKKPALNLPVTCLTDLSDPKPDALEVKSVKDRMLLSTDNTSCLLFTQTVTSPMLTPSEENIDFLKALQNQTILSENSATTTSFEKSEITSQEKDVPVFDSDDTVRERNVPIFDPNVTISEPDSEVLGLESEGNSKIDSETEEDNLELIPNKSESKGAEEGANNQEDIMSPDKNEIIYENAEFLREHADNMESIYENVHVIRENSKSSSECKAAASEISGDVDEENLLNLKENSGNGDFKAETSKFIQNEILCLENDENLGTKGSQQIENGKLEPLELIEDSNQFIPENQEVLEDEIDLDKLHLSQQKTEPEPDVIRCSKEPVPANNLIENQFEEVEKMELNEERTEAKETVSEMKQHTEDLSSKEYTMVESVESVNKFESEKVKSLKMHFMKTDSNEVVTIQKTEEKELEELKSFNIMKKISKFESNSVVTKDSATTNACSNQNNSSTITHTETHYVEATTDLRNGEDKALKKKKSKKSKKDHEKENISVTETKEEESFYNVNVKNLCRSFGDLTKIEKDKHKNKLERNWKSSFNKFDALQKKNVLHVRSSDASKAQEKFAGSQVDNSNCKACDKPVFQMELIKAEKAVWHKGCFRCLECKKQLNVDTFESHEGNLYCKPHFKALFAPKVVDDDAPPMPRKYELIIRENQPQELPPDVVRASDKPDLGLEELQSLNVKERFQVFEHHQSETSQVDKSPSPVNVKRSPSILSKLARFQAKGMNVGVTDESLNGIPVELSESEEEEEEVIEGEDADLIRAKRVQKEKPFHFVQLSDVKNKWENVNESSKDERREERKQEIQTIRSRLFLGKQGKMKEAYQQAVMETESGPAKKTEPIEITRELADTRTIKEKFEKGELTREDSRNKEQEDMSVFESGISKKSRSIFQELDANSSKPPQISPVSTPKLGLSVRNARDAYLNRTLSEDVVKASDQVDEVVVQTADIQDRFKFFETYREPEKQRKQFRITPPREGQVKGESPEPEIYRDPELVRAEDFIEDSVVAKQTHTATKMLNKFRQMEENLYREQEPQGPKPLKRFTPPREPIRRETSSEEEESGSDEESEEGEENGRPTAPDQDLVEAQKAARARQLRAKFERWESEEVKRENASVNIAEELGTDEQSQIETTKSLRARFESLKETSSAPKQAPKVKVNRFV